MRIAVNTTAPYNSALAIAFLNSQYLSLTKAVRECCVRFVCAESRLYMAGARAKGNGSPGVLLPMHLIPLDDAQKHKKNILSNLMCVHGIIISATLSVCEFCLVCASCRIICQESFQWPDHVEDEPPLRFALQCTTGLYFITHLAVRTMPSSLLWCVINSREQYLKVF
jgi:hypothetical protein